MLIVQQGVAMHLQPVQFNKNCRTWYRFDKKLVYSHGVRKRLLASFQDIHKMSMNSSDSHLPNEQCLFQLPRQNVAPSVHRPFQRPSHSIPIFTELPVTPCSAIAV